MVPDTPPPSFLRPLGPGHHPPAGGRELVRLARSYRAILLAELATPTGLRELTALHREALAVEEAVGAAEVSPADRSRALRLLAAARRGSKAAWPRFATTVWGNHPPLK